MNEAGLRWERQDSGALWAYSGKLIVAMVGSGGDGRRYWWRMEARPAPLSLTVAGERSSPRRAQSAAETCWRKWCAAAKLASFAT